MQPSIAEDPNLVLLMRFTTDSDGSLPHDFYMRVLGHLNVLRDSMAKALARPAWTPDRSPLPLLVVAPAHALDAAMLKALAAMREACGLLSPDEAVQVSSTAAVVLPVPVPTVLGLTLTTTMLMLVGLRRCSKP